MPPTLSTEARNASCNAVVDVIDTGGGPGKLEVLHSDGTTVLATFTLPAAAFGSAGAVNPGEAVLQGTPLSATAPDLSAIGGTGTATTARFRKANDADVVTGLTVGTSGADINLSATTIATGVMVTINNGTITQPASAP